MNDTQAQEIAKLETEIARLANGALAEQGCSPITVIEEEPKTHKKRVSKAASEIQDQGVASIARALGDILNNMGAPIREQCVQLIRDEFNSLYETETIVLWKGLDVESVRKIKNHMRA